MNQKTINGGAGNDNLFRFSNVSNFTLDGGANDDVILNIGVLVHLFFRYKYFLEQEHLIILKH